MAIDARSTVSRAVVIARAPALHGRSRKRSRMAAVEGEAAARLTH